MPLYEYGCRQCGRRFEVIQKFSDSPLETCDVCGGAIERLLSAPAIQFKGTGWYITDYARKGGNGASSEKKSSESKTESKSESKTESKSEAKSDSKSESKAAGSKST